MMIGMNEFYRLTKTKDQSPLNIIGYISTFLIARYYYVLPDSLNGGILPFFTTLIIFIFLVEKIDTISFVD